MMRGLMMKAVQLMETNSNQWCMIIINHIVGAVANPAPAVGSSCQFQVLTQLSLFLIIEYFSDQIASPFIIDPKKLKEKEVDTIIVEVKI